VRIQWDVFKRAAFRPPTPAAGHAYGDFAPTRPLRGTVIGRSGAQWKGKIVFDLDESETWEMLDGVREGIGYSIPFERVRSIEPLESRTTLVTLTNGQKLQLGDTQDVGAKNAGVLILAPGSAPEHYVPWRDVMRIDFE
jgi:hypothetical protein